MEREGEIYDVSGRKVFGKLRRGIYFIGEGRSFRKVVVR
jgi:hypothetical protein